MHLPPFTTVSFLFPGARPFLFFFFNDTATTEIYTLSLHDALPIWRLHWQTGWLLALEDAIDVGCRTSVWFGRARCVRNKSPASNVVALSVDRGKPIPIRQRDDQRAPRRRSRTACHNQTAIRGAPELSYGGIRVPRNLHRRRPFLPIYPSS